MSDSDYEVENYFNPTVRRTTYEADDNYLSEEGDFDDVDETNEEEEKDVEIDEIKCSENNVTDVNKNEEVEVVRTNNRFILHISNLPEEISKQVLESLFAEAGVIKSVRLPKKRLGKFAFVEMMNLDGFKNALKFDGKELYDKKIQVQQGSKNKKHTSKSKILKRKKLTRLIQNKRQIINQSKPPKKF